MTIVLSMKRVIMKLKLSFPRLRQKKKIKTETLLCVRKQESFKTKTELVKRQWSKDEDRATWALKEK